MQGAPAAPLGRPRTSSLAVAAMVLAGLGLCCPIVLPAAAILLAVFALREINEAPGTVGGRALAVASIWIGGVELVLQLILAVLLAIGIARTPAAEVFFENNVPERAVRWLRSNGHVAPDERILLYYDDSVLAPFRDVSVLTDRRVLTVVDNRASDIPLPQVQSVRYVPGSFVEDYVIEVGGADGRYLKLVFTEGADVEGFARRLAEEVGRAGGPELEVERAGGPAG